MPEPSPRRAPFVTDPLLRGVLTRRGFDPDDPETAALFARMMDVGPQPATGFFRGDIPAFVRGALGSVSNTVRGLGDLPLAIGRAAGVTDARIPARTPSLVEQVNPTAAGLGELGGTIGQMLIPARALAGIPQLRKLGVMGELRAAGFGTSEARAVLTQAELMGDVGLAAGRAARARTAAGVPGGILGGLQPEAIASRAIPAGGTFALLGAAQPGEISERLQRAAQGLEEGLVLGALGPPSGLSRLQNIGREMVAAGAAFGDEPIVEGIPLPGAMQTALFGVVAGGTRRAGRQIPEISRVTGKPIARGEALRRELPIRESLRAEGRTPRTPPLPVPREALEATDRLLRQAHQLELPFDSARMLYEAAIPRIVQARRGVEGKGPIPAGRVIVRLSERDLPTEPPVEVPGAAVNPQASRASAMGQVRQARQAQRDLQTVVELEGAPEARPPGVTPPELDPFRQRQGSYADAFGRAGEVLDARIRAEARIEAQRPTLSETRERGLQAREEALQSIRLRQTVAVERGDLILLDAAGEPLQASARPLIHHPDELAGLVGVQEAQRVSGYVVPPDSTGLVRVRPATLSETLRLDPRTRRRLLTLDETGEARLLDRAIAHEREIERLIVDERIEPTVVRAGLVEPGAHHPGPTTGPTARAIQKPSGVMKTPAGREVEALKRRARQRMKAFNAALRKGCGL